MNHWSCISWTGGFRKDAQQESRKIVLRLEVLCFRENKKGHNPCYLVDFISSNWSKECYMDAFRNNIQKIDFDEMRSTKLLWIYYWKLESFPQRLWNMRSLPPSISSINLGSKGSHQSVKKTQFIELRKWNRVLFFEGSLSFIRSISMKQLFRTFPQTFYAVQSPNRFSYC